MTDAAPSGKGYYDSIVLNDAPAKPSIKHAISVVERFRDGKVKRGLMTSAQTELANKVVKQLEDALNDWVDLTKQFPRTPQ